MADDATIARATAVLALLADRHRLRILARLAADEATVGELEALVGLSQPVTSYHLARLRRAGLVRARPDGTPIRVTRAPGLR